MWQELMEAQIQGSTTIGSPWNVVAYQFPNLQKDCFLTTDHGIKPLRPSVI